MSESRLNRAQRDAVTTLVGPLLVLAGAGTGKTRVITHRIAELIRSGVSPERILAVTFTNKAALEMRQRQAQLRKGSARGSGRPEISTFHSLCVRILRRQIHRLGYPKGFAIYDRGDQESVARAALRDLHVAHEKLRPSDLIAQISRWKSASSKPEQALSGAADDRQQLAALAYERYQRALVASGALDFDDLLLCTERLFVEHADARHEESRRFEHLLIDEYQDTSGLQYRIVFALAEGHRNLCVVGDDDQSIYGFRGAEVSHILSFERDWPGTKVVRLEDNYRSSESILALANTLIAHNSARHQKVLRAARPGGVPPRFLRYESETEEAEGVVREIRALAEGIDGARVAFSELAILFRTNEQPRVFETELRRARIPYVLVGGMSFYDRKEVRDIMAYLRVLATPSDEVALLRVINTPPRGIGASSIEILLKQAVMRGVPVWSLLSEGGALPDVPDAIRSRLRAFVELVLRFRERCDQPLAPLARELLEAVNYRAEVERIYKTALEADARWQSVEELVNAIAQYEVRASEASLLGFLEEATLADRDETRDDSKRTQRAVTLMTLHSAKGLEFGHVYMVGMEEGLLPHRRSVADGAAHISEERRLCYVGVTRAKEALTLSFCRQRMKWGKLVSSIPSRFLMEMRGETERAERAARAAAARLEGKPESAARSKRLATAQRKTTQRKTTQRKTTQRKTTQRKSTQPKKQTAKRRD